MAEWSCSGLQSRLRRSIPLSPLVEITKIGIVGFGFVGKALNNGLFKNVETYIVDPKLSTRLDDLTNFSPEIIFVSSNLMNQEGDQDISILKRF